MRFLRSNSLSHSTIGLGLWLVLEVSRVFFYYQKSENSLLAVSVTAALSGQDNKQNCQPTAIEMRL